LPRVGEVIANVQTGKPGDLYAVTRIEHSYWAPQNRSVTKHKALTFTRKVT
jgi:hypothetical protein